MFLIDDATATAIMPAITAAATAGGWYQSGDPGLNVPATTISAESLNIVQAELLNLLSAASITPVKATLTQVTSAVRALVKGTSGLKYLNFATTTNLAGAATSIIGPSGISTAHNGAMWVLPFSGTITGVYISVSTAPAGVQTATATVYNNTAATSASAVITGSATSATWAGTPIAVSATNGLSMLITMSATAATSYVRGYITVVPS